MHMFIVRVGSDFRILAHDGRFYSSQRFPLIPIFPSQNNVLQNNQYRPIPTYTNLEPYFQNYPPNPLHPSPPPMAFFLTNILSGCNPTQPLNLPSMTRPLPSNTNKKNSPVTPPLPGYLRNDDFEIFLDEIFASFHRSLAMRDRKSVV